ncbi:MAG: MogA/MoaB family molybdenum cofactor biosynthesis protein, partial [Desulfovibrionaceae bacterium]|nr:MogA/MoaB family molybdenum cofactor biosynthesis protein [Desulfovibrionaceae bacterium]
MLTLHLAACSKGGVLPIATQRPAGATAHLVLGSRPGPCPPAALPRLSAGTRLRGEAGRDLLLVTGHAWLCAADGGHALFCPLVRACTDLPAGRIALEPVREGLSLAWITLSDRGSLGLREDASGPAMEEMVRERLDVGHAQGYLLPDDPARLRALITALALDEGYDLVLTSGGTGVAPSDLTPEATSRVLDRELPGFAQAMMQASLAKTPMGAISRAKAGIVGRTLVINLPGS